MGQIFISHAERDGPVARDLGTELEKAGFRVWFYERDSLPGATYISQVAEALRECRVVVVIVSPGSLKSNQVTNEIVRAYEGDKHFIPVLYGISHEEFRKARDDWRQCLGASTSVGIPGQGVAAIVPRIARGLEHLGIKPGEAPRPPEPKPIPRPVADPARMESKPEPAQREPERGPAAKSTSVAPGPRSRLPKLPWRRWQFWTGIGAVAAAVVVVVAVVVRFRRDDATLLLSRLGVAIPQGGSEEVTVAATDEHNQPREFSVECDSPEVASVTKTGSTIAVAGLSYGTANVTVSCGTSRKTFPVQVYDPMVLETDELLIRFVDSLDWRWNISGGGPHATFWHPGAPDGYKPLGSAVTPGLVLAGNEWVVVVRAKPGSDALKPPDDYRLLWSSEGVAPRYRGQYENPGSFWLPVPPTGYRALGMVVQQGFGKPGLDDVVCVREDLTAPGELAGSVVSGRVGRGKDDMLWEARPIVPSQPRPYESCYLPVGTFAFSFLSGGAQPDSQRVLKVKLPLLAEAPPQVFRPRLTGDAEPPEYTEPLQSWELLVPWILVNDAARPTVEQRVRSTPFYRVERRVLFKHLDDYENRSSEAEEFTPTCTSGVTGSASDGFRGQTGVSLSVESGVSAELHSCYQADMTVALGPDLGFVRPTDVSVFEEKSMQVRMDVPPKTAVALWLEVNQFVVKRHDGSNLQEVARLEFATGNYDTVEYPLDE